MRQAAFNAAERVVNEALYSAPLVVGSVSTKQAAAVLHLLSRVSKQEHCSRQIAKFFVNLTCMSMTFHNSNVPDWFGFRTTAAEVAAERGVEPSTVSTVGVSHLLELVLPFSGMELLWHSFPDSKRCALYAGGRGHALGVIHRYVIILKISNLQSLARKGRSEEGQISVVNSDGIFGTKSMFHFPADVNELLEVVSKEVDVAEVMRYGGSGTTSRGTSTPRTRAVRMVAGMEPLHRMRRGIV